MTTTSAPDADTENPDHGVDDSATIGDHETDAPDIGDTGPLLPVSVTADRERDRLRRAAGRHGPMRLVAAVAPSIRHLGTAQAAQNGLRYRPVAWTFIAIVAVAFYLPGRIDGPAVPQPVASPSPVVTAAPSDEAPNADEQQPVPTPEFTPVTPVPTFSPTASAPLPLAAGPAPTVAPAPPADDVAAAEPLHVRGWAWASRLPATPLPTDAVAADTVPVANRLGTVDRVSFLRLAGDDTELVLVEHSDSSREALGPGMVAICPILDDGWEEGPGQTFDDAPAWDTEACIGGDERDDTWTFDLSGFSDRAAETGFALVPTVDAPADFQVSFEVAGV